MANLSNLDFILIFAYFAVLLIIGYLTSRRQKPEDYLIAERKLGAWSTMATINASKTGSVLMIFVALVYLWGVAALWYFIGMVIGVLVFLPFALRLKENSKQRFYTLADYFKYNYGKKIAVLVSLVTILLMFGYLVLNLMAGTKIFVFFTGWPFWLCAIIMVVIVMIYLLMGGFKAVVKTDIIQYIAMVVILVLLALALFRGAIIPASEWNFFNVNFATMIGFFLVGILFPFAMPDMWQRVYSSRDKKTLKKGILLSAVVYAFFAFLLGLVALTVKVRFPTVDPDLALIHGFANLLPAGLLGLALVLLFAAIMSTADTYIFTGSSAIVQDFFKLAKKKIVKNLKKTIFILAVIGTLISILLQDLIISTYIFASFLLVLAISVMATWLHKKIKQRTLFIGAIIGVASTIALLIYFLGFVGEVQPFLVVIAIVATIIGLIIGGIVSKLTSKRKTIKRA
jgi:Na+/proline symporter